MSVSAYLNWLNLLRWGSTSDKAGFLISLSYLATGVAVSKLAALSLSPGDAPTWQFRNSPVFRCGGSWEVLRDSEGGFANQFPKVPGITWSADWDESNFWY